MNRKAVVLLSGGLDSATISALAASLGFDLYALSFSYGQRHSVELEAAKNIATSYMFKDHLVIELNPSVFVSSSLSGVSGKAVPKDRDVDHASDIPSTYVPARNILFLSYALSYSETIDATDIFIGVNALDYSGYPDCRPEFIAAYQTMANLGTKSGSQGHPFVIHAPLQNMKKSEIILKGVSLGVDYSITHSCYDPAFDGAACGRCDSCLLRKKGFLEAGVPDPTRYSGRR
jgi:7-cyano-7-deazaguanine synthase